MMVPVIDVRTPELFGPHGVGDQTRTADFVRLGSILALPADASARMEHCMISSALADALGISPAVGVDDGVRVRVAAGDDPHSRGRSFLFTVCGSFWTYPSQNELRLYPDEGAQIGGARRLYGGDVPDIAFASVWL